MLYIIMAYYAVLTLMVSNCAVSSIATFSFRFCCFVFDVNQLKDKFADNYAITKPDYELIPLHTNKRRQRTI